ncbi:MAG TPA: cobyric acid synthase, partial [Dehalococcoidia bacterium]|nr:cobyric acid synthase [Dehalococcoidia bacterium]
SVTSSIDSLRSKFDLVIIEGAGSPAEINLKKNEIVNMSVAKYCQSPVLLCGDIDRGGVFASLVGTLELLDDDENNLIKGFIINKFRGDIRLLDDGLTWLENRTGKKVAGVIHHYNDIHIPEEDSVALDIPNRHTNDANINIRVIQLPHISNFDDFDPFSRDSMVNLSFASTPEEISDSDLIIIPGSKSTIADLIWMEKTGMLDKINILHESSHTPIIGICGGYQIIGSMLLDPNKIESNITKKSGMSLLSHTTTFDTQKSTHRINGKVLSTKGLLKHANGDSISGYEIHMGETENYGNTNSPFQLTSRQDI